jgi:hypothetical protein
MRLIQTIPTLNVSVHQDRSWRSGYFEDLGRFSQYEPKGAQMMVRGPQPSKVKEWRDRLRRFKDSGQTVVEFCQGEQVSTPSFYQWKKKLAGSSKTPRASRRKSARTATGFQELRVSSVDGSPVTIRLPDGITIELGRDLSVIKNIMAQLLDGDRRATNGKGRPTGGEPC